MTLMCQGQYALGGLYQLDGFLIEAGGLLFYENAEGSVVILRSTEF